MSMFQRRLCQVSEISGPVLQRWPIAGPNLRWIFSLSCTTGAESKYVWDWYFQIKFIETFPHCQIPRHRVQMLCYAPGVKFWQSNLDLNQTREVLVWIRENQFSLKTRKREEKSLTDLSHFCQRLSHHCVPNLLTWVLGVRWGSEMNEVTEELSNELVKTSKN